MAPVVLLSITALNPLHDLGERHVLGLHQHMQVVGHQDIGIESKPVALPIGLDAFKVCASVLVVLKGSVPLIPTHDHMIQRPVKLYSGLACHARQRSHNEDSKSILRPDPISDREARLIQNDGHTWRMQ